MTTWTMITAHEYVGDDGRTYRMSLERGDRAGHSGLGPGPAQQQRDTHQAGSATLPPGASKCRSCKAAVTWAITAQGKKMPVDREPNPQEGNCVLVWSDEDPHATAAVIVSKDALGAITKHGDSVPRYTSHFVTCPNRAQHRR